MCSLRDFFFFFFSRLLNEQAFLCSEWVKKGFFYKHCGITQIKITDKNIQIWEKIENPILLLCCEDITTLKKNHLRHKIQTSTENYLEHLDSTKFLNINKPLLIFDDTSYNSNAVPLTCTTLWYHRYNEKWKTWNEIKQSSYLVH